MKILSRDFTIKEKILILVLLVFLLGLAYFQFVDKPVRTALENAASEKAALTTELTAVKAKVAQLEKMQNEIDSIQKTGAYAKMPSYDNSKEVYKLFNDVLGPMNFDITFSNREKSGNIVRWNISLRFTAPDRAAVKQALREITECSYRCLISDLTITPVSGRSGASDTLSVSVSFTFYETMVGATTDKGING